MSSKPVNNQLDHLQRQIADVVAKIRKRQQAKNLEFEADVYELKLRPLSKVEGQVYNLVDNEAAYSLLGQNIPADSGYVTDAYNIVSRTDGKSTVVEGLVFDNNREFDFKV